MPKLRNSILFLTAAFLVCPLSFFSQSGKEFVKFKAKIGFVNNEDRIKEYKFSADGKRIFIVGYNKIQLWNIEEGRKIEDASYSVREYPDFGKLGAILTFGISRLMKTGYIESNPDRDYFVAVEGEKENRKAVVRQTNTGKELSILDLPLAVSSLSFTEKYVLVSGEKNNETQMGIWDNADFRLKTVLSINQYKWHRFLKDEQKILVGSGDTKISWGGDFKQGNKLELRDVETGQIEKEFTIPNPDPKEYFHEINFSPDEKSFMARRGDRIFVWEIDGNGSPKYTIAPEDPQNNLDYIDFSRMSLFSRTSTQNSYLFFTGKPYYFNRKFIITKADNKLKVHELSGDGKPLLIIAADTPKESANFRGFINERFLVTEVGKNLQIYDINGDGKPKYEFAATEDKGKYRFIGITKDADYFAVRNDEKISFYEMNGSGRAIGEVSILDKESSSIHCFAEGYCIVKNKRKDQKTEPHISYIYNMKTGKIDYEVPHEFFAPEMNPNKNLLYEEITGSFFAWNLSERRKLALSLDTHSTTCSEHETGCTTQTYNVENVTLSPNEKFFIKSGSKTTIYDAATGEFAQELFDPQNVSYDKQGKIKSGGFPSILFSRDGKQLLTFKTPGSNLQTITVWDLVD